MSDDERRTEAIALLRATAERVKRRGTVPFPPTFVLAGESGGKTRLAELIQGGRGGEVRLKLYLSITMMATGRPYDLKRSPSPTRWAELLGLPLPEGARRVASNLKWLADNKYISLERRPGRTPLITLLAMDGSGGEYKPPRGEGRYLGVPPEFWTEGWIVDLPATTIAVLFCLLDLQGGQKEGRYITRDRRERYYLSNDTWTRATKDLVERGLLTVGRVPQGGDFDYTRMRNTYWIDISKLKNVQEVESEEELAPLINFPSR